MKFKRAERYSKIDITARKIRLIETRPERELKRLSAKLPLLAGVLSAPVPVDVRSELQARQAKSDAFERSMRALNAKVWRDSRRDYFAADDATRDAIRRAWDHWSGPRTSGNFRYVVDSKTGVQAARLHSYRVERAEALALNKAMSEAQSALLPSDGQ
ncbi:hypothetical protein H8Z72_22695 (plasmid) [Xanthomonas citri pv. citri]|uniref:hypothetical protein n=1 Tax=Xanthomonas citri TaxID=346 RepID=UPI0019331506|nr:hypothetical protein [Xanthomonas citri]QRD62661.1 hypothetical protein H8Z74_23490 [Xanthomonas citri pv. citri]QRD67196.1 hypothetical protein H8Z73_22470 [Xanthomonas citri pv. citri]QRD71759.1 hypothetical protein H8Z72_22695 [Xanthomonas citri pv. citri]